MIFLSILLVLQSALSGSSRRKKPSDDVKACVNPADQSGYIVDIYNLSEERYSTFHVEVRCADGWTQIYGQNPRAEICTADGTEFTLEGCEEQLINEEARLVIRNIQAPYESGPYYNSRSPYRHLISIGDMPPEKAYFKVLRGLDTWNGSQQTTLIDVPRSLTLDSQDMGGLTNSVSQTTLRYFSDMLIQDGVFAYNTNKEEHDDLQQEKFSFNNNNKIRNFVKLIRWNMLTSKNLPVELNFALKPYMKAAFDPALNAAKDLKSKLLIAGFFSKTESSIGIDIQSELTSCINNNVMSAFLSAPTDQQKRHMACALGEADIQNMDEASLNAMANWNWKTDPQLTPAQNCQNIWDQLMEDIPNKQTPIDEEELEFMTKFYTYLHQTFEDWKEGLVNHKLFQNASQKKKDELLKILYTGEMKVVDKAFLLKFMEKQNDRPGRYYELKDYIRNMPETVPKNKISPAERLGMLLIGKPWQDDSVLALNNPFHYKLAFQPFGPRGENLQWHGCFLSCDVNTASTKHDFYSWLNLHMIESDDKTFNFLL